MGFKFCKRTKIEVLNKVGEGSLGYSWRCAEIISGNGHTYTVRYDLCTPEVGLDVEKASRRDIRPRSPPEGGLRSCVPGDVVEVLVDGCLMPAQVMEVFVRGNCFTVRVLELSREFRAKSSRLRLRQSWKDNMWATIEKENAEDCDGKPGGLSKAKKLGKPQPCTVVNTYTSNHHRCRESDHCNEEPFQVSSRGKKKRKQLSTDDVKAGRKLGKSVEFGMRQRLIVGESSQLQKVDNVASPQIEFGENHLHNSSKDGRRGFPAKYDIVHITEGNPECSDSESLPSSVGSSSPSCSPHRSNVHLNPDQTQNLSTHSEDDDVLSEPGEEPFPKEGRARSNIHQLELNAYRSTLVALHASGPLNWEHETLLTNLRLMFHVTNDEHLQELKNLVNS